MPSWRGTLARVDVAYSEVSDRRSHGLEDGCDIFDVHAVEKDAIVGLDVCVSAKLRPDVLNALTAK